MSDNALSQSLLELIRRTSCHLPHDVQEVLNVGMASEKGNDMATFAMDMIMQNIDLAKGRSLPICQDTGTISFYVHLPRNYNPDAFVDAAREATIEATRLGYLRQNSVETLSGKNTGNNIGEGHPFFHVDVWDKEFIEAKLILKGGGCENVGIQYKLPAVFEGKKFGRDLEGVKACILDAVHQAQGKGCGPGFLGVCIGGDREGGYSFAKQQLLRAVDDVNIVPQLAALENEIVREANKLQIGPMGFSGKFTLGGCKIGARNRLPASYFVSIAYMCWAYRRRGVVLNKQGSVVEWLYQVPGEFEGEKIFPSTFEVKQKKVKSLTLPLSEADVRGLKVGDPVLLSGTIFTGRDAACKYLYDGGDLEEIHGGVLYHCGPVVVEDGNEYKVMAAGPTTSIREEPYQGELIKRFDIKAVIGKGGMGAKTLEACKDHGAVYLHAIGGAAQVYALCVEKVEGVHFKEQFGSPEAIWLFKVSNFPAVVTMDSHGKSLHEEVEKVSEEKLKEILTS